MEKRWLREDLSSRECSGLGCRRRGNFQTPRERKVAEEKGGKGSRLLHSQKMGSPLFQRAEGEKDYESHSASRLKLL